MRPVLSKSGRGLLRTPAGAKKINAGLFAVRAAVKPLELRGLTLSLKHIHVGRGMLKCGESTPAHCHQEIQIEYVLSGRFVFSGDAPLCRLAPGQGNVIFPNRSHAWRCESAGIMIGILLEATGPQRDLFLRTPPTLAVRRMPVFRSASIALWTRQIFDFLAIHPNPWRGECATSLLAVWLQAALAEALAIEAWLPHAQTKDDHANAHGQYACDRALDFMAVNFGRPTRLDDVAHHAGISARHLNRLFHRHVGRSINQQLAAMRLAKARSLLREQPGCSIKEVAYASGFCSPAYFTHCFKTAYGRLPRER